MITKLFSFIIMALPSLLANERIGNNSLEIHTISIKIQSNEKYVCTHHRAIV